MRPALSFGKSYRSMLVCWTIAIWVPSGENLAAVAICGGWLGKFGRVGTLARRTNMWKPRKEEEEEEMESNVCGLKSFTLILGKHFPKVYIYYEPGPNAYGLSFLSFTILIGFNHTYVHRRTPTVTGIIRVMLRLTH